jgi:hypothetical protein
MTVWWLEVNEYFSRDLQLENGVSLEISGPIDHADLIVLSHLEGVHSSEV